METVGLRELNRNPSKVVARVRAGESILVTDRGKPVLRMVPEPGVGEGLSILDRMILEGKARPPARKGFPEVIPELSRLKVDLSELLIADRDRDRSR